MSYVLYLATDRGPDRYELDAQNRVSFTRDGVQYHARVQQRAGEPFVVVYNTVTQHEVEFPISLASVVGNKFAVSARPKTREDAAMWQAIMEWGKFRRIRNFREKMIVN